MALRDREEKSKDSCQPQILGKIINFQTLIKITVIILNFGQCGFIIIVMCSKDADRLTNSVARS